MRHPSVTDAQAERLNYLRVLGESVSILSTMALRNGLNAQGLCPDEGWTLRDDLSHELSDLLGLMLALGVTEDVPDIGGGYAWDHWLVVVEDMAHQESAEWWLSKIEALRGRIAP